MDRRRRHQRKSGQTLVEYALILAFISVVAILVLQQLGGEVVNVYNKIYTKIQEAPTASSGFSG
ncbi:Flp family type IVb pilin [Verrucomicrobia bacterium LW23]|nr:Flp family type IVb pilin [Verrucomicrobia bacterium LW23]